MLSLSFTLNTIGQTSGDLNIAGASNGYMIGGNPVLTQLGDPTSIVVGDNVLSTFSTSQYNTLVGYKTGVLMTNEVANTFVGANAGNSVQFSVMRGAASYNTFIGVDAGYTTEGDKYNTFIGYEAGFTTNGNGSLNTGDFNTMVGFACGEYNMTGKGNDYYGKGTGLYNNGDINSMYGSHAGNGYTGGYTADSNAFFGNYSAFNIYEGNGNVLMGILAGQNIGNYNSGSPTSGNYNVFLGGYSAPLNPGGNYNITLGYRADAYSLGASPAPIYNSAAIGASAVVTIGNSIILGNDDQWTGIGLSYKLALAGATGYPNNSLEICARTQAGAIRTNSSGLRFTNLTNTSPYSIPQSGVLSLNGNGDVVWIAAPAASLGTCSTPTTLSSSLGGGIDMNNGNFYFLGNSSGYASNNVGIGWPCAGAQTAKLQIYQASGSNNTIAEYVNNADHCNGTVGNPAAVIGIKSQIPVPSSPTFYNVAGWFEAQIYQPSLLTVGVQNYAIFVPKILSSIGTLKSGGTVDIGYEYAIDNPNFLLKVNGPAEVNGIVIPSDTALKKNVSPFKYGIKAVRNLNPYTYRYNGIGGFDSTTTYIGLIAQDLSRNVPNGVISSLITKDTITHDTETIKNIYEEAVIYTAVNAIKEVDSAVRSNAHIDSLGQTKTGTSLDSIRTGLYNPGWLLTGNTGTTPGTNFIGTTDNNLEFKIYNYWAGILGDGEGGGLGNTYFGVLCNTADVGADNTGIGASAFYDAGYGCSGDYNTALGVEALRDLATGNCNTGVGMLTGSTVGLATGSYNTYVGFYATDNAGTYNNSTALGYSTSINASNQVDIGNTSITTIQGEVNWSTYSDRRIKDSIQNNVPGLIFINKLKPVTYHLNIDQQENIMGIVDTNTNPSYLNHKYDIEKIAFSGLIAQQVDSAANQCSYNFSGVKKPPTSNGLYGLSYSDFVVPLIKAVQQLSATKDSMRSKLDSVQSTLDSLRTAFQSFQNCLNQLCGDSHSGHHRIINNPSDSNTTTNVENVILSSENTALLYQNIPNPFSTGTKINYFLPQGTMGAYIVFYDSYGNQIKTVQLSQTGNGTLNITPENLTNGIYSYSLVVNGNVIDTKRMVLQK